MSTRQHGVTAAVDGAQRLTKAPGGHRRKPCQIPLRLDAGPRFADGSPYRVHRDPAELSSGVPDRGYGYRTKLYHQWLAERDRARSASGNGGRPSLVSWVRSGFALMIGRRTPLGSPPTLQSPQDR